MTETQTQSTAPEHTLLHRVASIPLVADSLESIHHTLSTNPYTRSPYATAQGLSKAAFGYTEPIQKTFAPLLVRAEGLANKGLDVVESRYPYPFKTPTGDIVKDLKGRSDQARDLANKTIDEKVKTPALTVVQGIDQRFAPVLDYFQDAVKKIYSSTGTSESASPTEPPKYQYQRALALSKDLSDQLVKLSAEQINQIKTQNVLVKHATEAAQQVTTVASSSYGAAQEKVHAVSDAMLQELRKVQQSTATLPTQLQSSFNDISVHLTTTISDISSILTSSDPLNEKVHKIRDHVQERVNPLLEATQARAQEILDSLRGKAAENTDAATNGSANGSINGNGAAH
ncbi:uncharacterized protein PHACADRAFT_252264 [Phanerochaete carnosa HHB-10118-sp]|uniref:Lipid droplet-associated perilipin protein n=1 Tax=Phanerochaete carnosa (strain HHB-10118-sp) TaxID=650164 RepID=K5W2Q7_PHACS|nr:uncharacterized protein PHACADRAFT_252264 [Phanerochaete carnosa HHB-10118-sp]EKM58168.1 hypothetical protein PHACADRAFT_252264 [Phanerochaete carnosa HHB-10118-sp]